MTTTTPQITDEMIRTLVNINVHDNNGDRAAANAWEDINDFCEGKGGFFQVKTYLATLITALDRRLTEQQMDKVFPYGNEILAAFGWTITELFEHDIYAAIFEGVDGETSIVYDRTAELADATEGDLAKAENMTARNFAYALKNILALWNEELPELAAPARVFVAVAEHTFA
jgi:hypothetical protein